MDSHLPLSDAARTLGLPWEAAWRLVLTRRLDAERRSNRWYVSRESVERLATELKAGVER
jgi:hypothetical protein